MKTKKRKNTYKVIENDNYRAQLRGLYSELEKTACAAGSEVAHSWSELELARFLRELKALPKAKKAAA